MVNALMITTNINLVQALLSEIKNSDLEIRIAGLSTNHSRTIELLNSKDFKLIFLDKSMKDDYDKSFIESYRNIIIPISYKDNSSLLSTKRLVFLKDFIKKYDLDIRRANIIRELEFIGFKLKYKGTQYLIDTILQIMENQISITDNLQTQIYPIVGKKYNRSALNIKSSINKATECMYYECDEKRLQSYFHCGEDSKPTVKQVMFTVISNI